MQAMTDATAVGIWGFITVAATVRLETNYKNKVPEYRVTLRPLPDLLPGFQATYFGLYGQGNSSTRSQFNGTPSAATPYQQYYPDWIVNLGYLSYQNPWFILTAQAFWSKGPGRQLDHCTE